MTQKKEIAWEAMPLLRRWLILCQATGVNSTILKMFPGFQGQSKEGLGEQFPASPWQFFENNFKPLMRGIPIRLWREVIQAAPVHHVPLTARETKHTNDLSLIWRRLESKKRVERLEAVEPLVELLQESWSWNVVNKQHIGNETVLFVHLEKTGLNLPPLMPLIVTFVFGREGSAKTACRWTRDLWRRLASGKKTGPEVTLNVVVGEGVELQRYLKEMKEEQGFVLIDEGAVKEIYTSDRYSAKLHNILHQNLGLGRLNPYVFDKPVEKQEMFYGREAEIRKILDISGRDFIIVGSRKIGKSSLLKNLIATTSGSESRIPIYIDCAQIETPDQFAEAIAVRVNPRRRKSIRPAQLPQLVGAKSSFNRVPFLFLLDEIDPLIRFSRINGDWSALSALRSISNNKWGQTVLAGYREVYKAWQDLDSPLFNMVQPMYLSVLGEESARKLITRPMQEIGVTFEHKDLVRQILKDSGCHPSVLQFFGSSLVERLDFKDSRRVLADDIHAVREMRLFTEFLVKPFRTDNNLADNLEKWLVLRIVKDRQERFSADSLLAAFDGKERKWLKVGRLSQALEGLELSGLICRESERGNDEEPHQSGVTFVWTIPGFAVALEKTENVVRWESELRKELEDE